MRKTPLARLLATTASVFAINSAMAQQQGVVAGGDVESVVVTGTLISRPGYTAPTPVTSVTASDLQTAAPVEVADVLNQMPQFGAATTNPIGGGKGASGISAVNLRNLGPTRTLVLLDGERLPAYGTANAVDIDAVPQNIIKRVDVVTGGASAAYGSDAVAGVVNMILDTDYVGLKGNLQYGNTQGGIYETYKGDLAAGTSFDGDRGHVLLSLSYSDSPNIVHVRDAKWYTSRGGEAIFMPNPAYTPGGSQPQLIRVPEVGLNTTSEGGIISTGPLRGTQFVGPNGTPMPFYFGTSVGQYSYGGSGTAGFGPQFTTTAGDMQVLAQPNYNFNSFLYASYKLPFNVKAHVSLDYNGSGGYSDNYPPAARSNITISINNAYLPAQTRAAMQAAGVTSFVMGSTFGNLGELDRGADTVENVGDKKQTRFEVGFDGAIGSNWSWSAYYTHGEVHDTQLWVDDPYLPYLNNAINAVVAPAGNSAGLAAGTIVCASTLINPTDGCVPLDMFGNHVASPEAVRYIDGTPEWQRIVNKQDAAQISAQGTPFSDWAGDVSVAVGADYRSESSTSTSNPLAYTHLYGSGNASAFHGAVDVWEGFGEVIVPLAKNEWWSEQADFNASGRITDYSSSGLVETWKLGATDQVTDEFRLRATWSYDIRAPNLAELFTAQTSGSNAIYDPFTQTTPNVRQVTEGNPNLTPETATTFSGGVTYTPNWLSGFTASVDWYSINIKNAIGKTPNALTYCYLGFTVYCPLVIRNSSGVVTEVDSYPVNTAVASTSGLDVEMTYTTGLLGGNLSLHGLANYTDENTNTLNGVTLDNAGSLGTDTLGGGVPKLKSVISATFDYGPFSGTVQTRIWGSARYSAAYAPSFLGDANNIAPIAYLDLRGSYNFGSSDQYQVYFAVDNMLDQDPPSLAPLYTMQPYTPPTLFTTYDTLGRVGRLGIRMNL